MPDSSSALILLQIFSIWALSFWMYRSIAPRYKHAPIDDIGILWLLAMVLYATLPPLVWLLKGSTYEPYMGRLFQLQPNHDEVIYLLNIALAYVAGFSITYYKATKQAHVPWRSDKVYINSPKLIGAGVLVLFAYIVGLFLSFSGFIRFAESYSDSYLVIAELPIVLRQIIKFVEGISTYASLVLVVGLIQRWPRYWWVLVIYFLSLLLTYDVTGSRLKALLSLIVVVICWHVLIKPISAKKIFLGGALVLALFMGLGALRGFLEGADLGISVGEFDQVWANAIDLNQMRMRETIDVPFEVRFSEFSSFIPSQLLTTEKLDLSTWYVDSFYRTYKESGGGLAFGAISQAVIGGGMFEALIRGLLLGKLCFFLTRWFNKPTSTWWRFPLQLSMLISVYHSVRTSTFAPFISWFQIFVPTIVAINIIEVVVTRRYTKLTPLRRSDPTTVPVVK